MDIGQGLVDLDRRGLAIRHVGLGSGSTGAVVPVGGVDSLEPEMDLA